ncbi:MAG: hypothetical protein MZU79_04570 [Anaerotruncus sp.]|nr:hypothetical protein [Anaerotruncus sp.]
MDASRTGRRTAAKARDRRWAARASRAGAGLVPPSAAAAWRERPRACRSPPWRRRRARVGLVRQATASLPAAPGGPACRLDAGLRRRERARAAPDDRAGGHPFGRRVRSSRPLPGGRGASCLSRPRRARLSSPDRRRERRAGAAAEDARRPGRVSSPSSPLRAEFRRLAVEAESLPGIRNAGSWKDPSSRPSNTCRPASTSRSSDGEAAEGGL